MSISFSEALSRISQDDINKADRMVFTRELQMANNGSLFLSGEDGRLSSVLPENLLMSDYALTQGLNRLGMPVAYSKKLFEERKDLVASQWNHWALQQGTAQTLLRFRETPDGDTGVVRGMLSSRYSALDNKDVIRALVSVCTQMRESFGLTPDVTSMYLDDHFTHFRVTLPALEKSVAPGDALQVGFDVDNSEVGASSLRVVPLVYRLVCTNGLRAWRTDGDIFSQRHIHLNSSELYARMSNAIAKAIKAGDDTVEAMVAASKIKVENPLEEIANLLKEKYSQQFTAQVQTAYTSEVNPTKYGIVNALTKAAQTLPVERKIDVEEFAGAYLFKKAS